MKLLGKELEKDSSGTLTLIVRTLFVMPSKVFSVNLFIMLFISFQCEETEDMWHVYNLVAVGDRVRASTIRKVTTESATGSTTSNRVRTTLTLEVTDIDFDTQGCRLRLKGRNVAENAHVKMGAYHTIDVEPNRKFSLLKAEWDSVALERIELATDPSKHADLAAVVMQEGLAHVCLVTASMTVVRAKIDLSIPRKRRGNASQHEKALTRFYDAVLQAVLRHVDFAVVKAVLVASPGFVRDKFLEFAQQHAVRNDLKVLLENKPKFVPVHSSSGFKHSLKEVLQDPAVQARLSDTKAAEEVRALDAFYKTLSNDPLRACYGEKHVEKAVEQQAVEQLLISDRLFRAQDVARRKKFVRIVDDVREFGGDVRIFSSLHVSGEQLDQLTGLCAVLRFPMQELDEDDSEDSDSD